MNKIYIVKGDHPTFKRQDYTFSNLLDLIRKLHELHRAGYEVEIQTEKAS